MSQYGIMRQKPKSSVNYNFGVDYTLPDPSKSAILQFLRHRMWLHTSQIPHAIIPLVWPRLFVVRGWPLRNEEVGPDYHTSCDPKAKW